MDNIDIFDRVIITEDFKTHTKLLTKGSIGTCRQLVEDSILMQYDVNISGNAQIVIIPKDLVKKVQYTSELTNTDYKKLIPKSYYIDNCFIKDNKIGIIADISLGINEMKDKFLLRFKDESSEILARSELDIAYSFVPIDMKDSFVHLAELTADERLQKEDYNMTVNGIEFKIVGDELHIPLIKLSTTSNLIDALNKLKNMLKGAS